MTPSSSELDAMVAEALVDTYDKHEERHPPGGVVLLRVQTRHQ
jgi:hypothetical protein